jgi:hypothetical protein
MIGDITILVGAVGAVIAVLTFLYAQRNIRTEFEDALASEYRELARRLPIDALLGEPGSKPGSAEFKLTLPLFYSYFDLSNEQGFLAQKKRIRADTWADWQDGIAANLTKPQFEDAWLYIAERAAARNELQRVADIWILVHPPLPRPHGAPDVDHTGTGGMADGEAEADPSGDDETEMRQRGRTARSTTSANPSQS